MGDDGDLAEGRMMAETTPRRLRVDMSLLEVALDGRGAFGRFKRVLSDYPEPRERWFRTRDAFAAERQREWLATLGIEAVDVRGPVLNWMAWTAGSKAWNL